MKLKIITNNGTSSADIFTVNGSSQAISFVNGVTAPTFNGSLTGNVTGNLTGNVTGSLTGNAASATIANTAISANTSTSSTALTTYGSNFANTFLLKHTGSLLFQQNLSPRTYAVTWSVLAQCNITDSININALNSAVYVYQSDTYSIQMTAGQVIPISETKIITVTSGNGIYITAFSGTADDYTSALRGSILVHKCA